MCYAHASVSGTGTSNFKGNLANFRRKFFFATVACSWPSIAALAKLSWLWIIWLKPLSCLRSSFVVFAYCTWPWSLCNIAVDHNLNHKQVRLIRTGVFDRSRAKPIVISDGRWVLQQSLNEADKAAPEIAELEHVLFRVYRCAWRFITSWGHKRPSHC